MNKIINIADKYMTAKYGDMYCGDFFLIERSAPVMSVRDDVKEYLGDDITVTPGDAQNIIRELKAGGYDFVTHKATGIMFMAGDPSDFIKAVAMVIEL